MAYPAGRLRAAGKDAAPTAYACLWNAAGTLLAASASFALSNQSFGLGHNTKYTKDLVSPPTVNGGVTVYPGWARLSTSAHQYGYDNGGTDHYKYANATIPGSMNYGTVDGNNIGVFLYYQLANSAPNAPTLLTPSGGVILTGTDLTPALSFKYTDPEGNNSSAYQVQVDDNSDSRRRSGTAAR